LSYAGIVTRDYAVPSNRVFIDSAFEAARIYALASKNGWLCMLGSDQPSFEHPVLSPVGPVPAPENISRWRALEPLVGAHGNSSLKVKVRFL
jgi:hypothetical protein